MLYLPTSSPSINIIYMILFVILQMIGHENIIIILSAIIL